MMAMNKNNLILDYRLFLKYSEVCNSGGFLKLIYAKKNNLNKGGALLNGGSI